MPYEFKDYLAGVRTSIETSLLDPKKNSAAFSILDIPKTPSEIAQTLKKKRMLHFYQDYINWLINEYANASGQGTQITTSFLLLQLEIISQYHNYLLQTLRSKSYASASQPQIAECLLPEPKPLAERDQELTHIQSILNQSPKATFNDAFQSNKKWGPLPLALSIIGLAACITVLALFPPLSSLVALAVSVGITASLAAAPIGIYNTYQLYDRWKKGYVYDDIQYTHRETIAENLRTLHDRHRHDNYSLGSRATIHMAIVSWDPHATDSSNLADHKMSTGDLERLSRNAERLAW